MTTGPVPDCVTAMDDEVLEASCSGDTVGCMVRHIEEDFAYAWVDRRIDEEEARHLAAHLGQTDRYVDAHLLVSLGRVRSHCNDVLAVVSGLRARCQELKKAVRQDGMYAQRT